MPGFGVRVAQSGRKSFIVRYSAADGRKRRLTLGAYPMLTLADARDKSREALAAVARGEDPRVRRRPSGGRRPSVSWRRFTSSATPR
ncbi:MAG: Arm DNA-binding domain-containing protein [Acidobacteriota bacterium]